MPSGAAAAKRYASQARSATARTCVNSRSGGSGTPSDQEASGSARFEVQAQHVAVRTPAADQVAVSQPRSGAGGAQSICA